ncbi:SapB/AmfS family lanthipeptide [Lysinibacillus sp. NPDC093688]|uniref:SapB/AmfS family lanthipeptide n=1 Tax=Lysinibacillus sp. NPDC093688 TaxID=3390577 RepID=UPI003D02B620
MVNSKKKSNVLKLQKMNVENGHNLNGAARNSANSQFLCVGYPSQVSVFNCHLPGF